MEEFYRNRCQYDRIVRSTHGVNCTGGCTWKIHVKDGIVGWETQQKDYPLLNGGIPPREPRGCPRGITYSWYLYSPLRIEPPTSAALSSTSTGRRGNTCRPGQGVAKHRGKQRSRNAYTSNRGMGGFRRASWDDVVELMAGHTSIPRRKYGPIGSSVSPPIPAMSMISYAAGSRFLQLFGGVCLSFYDWYCDLPTASRRSGASRPTSASRRLVQRQMIAYMGLCGSNSR